MSAAADRAAYATAIQDMLETLGDPVTRVVPERAAEPPASPGEPDPRSWWTADSVLVVSLRNPTDLDDFNRTTERLVRIADTIRAARRVVFNLRASVAEETALNWVLGEAGFYTVDGTTLPPGDSTAAGRTAVILVNDRSYITGWDHTARPLSQRPNSTPQLIHRCCPSWPGSR